MTPDPLPPATPTGPTGTTLKPGEGTVAESAPATDEEPKYPVRIKASNSASSGRTWMGEGQSGWVYELAVEYVRADIHQIAVEALEKAWLELESSSVIHECGSCKKGAESASDTLTRIRKLQESDHG